MKQPSICLQCGGSYFNVYAHAEECPGVVKTNVVLPVAPETIADVSPKYVRPVCEARIPIGGNMRLLCSLPRGHKGPHRP